MDITTFLLIHLVGGLFSAAWKYTSIPRGKELTSNEREGLIYGTIAAGLFWPIWWAWKWFVILLVIFTDRNLPR